MDDEAGRDEARPTPAGPGRILAVVAALVAVVVIAAFVAGRIAGDDEDAVQTAARGTATVELLELAPSKTYEGSLVYADGFTVVHRIPEPDDDEADEEGDGVTDAEGAAPDSLAPAPAVPAAPSTERITDLPVPGEIVEAGDVLFSADDRRVVVIGGDEPATRLLAPDVDDGPDVAQLERFLTERGHDPDGLVTVDETFTSDTADAVRRWQRSLGVDETGEVALGDVVFVPSALRVVETLVAESVDVTDATPLIVVTSVEREVTFDLDAEDRSFVAVDDVVDVELPDGTSAQAVVSSIRPAPTTTADFVVTAGIRDGVELPEVDRTPVEVTVTGPTASGLFVPASAILSRDVGGYAVEVVDGSGRARVVGVEIGVVAGRMVQVTSPSLAEAMTVIAP